MNTNRHWSTSELSILNGFATGELKPNRAQRDFLSIMFNCTSRRIQIWFQNHRAQYRVLLNANEYSNKTEATLTTTPKTDEKLYARMAIKLTKDFNQFQKLGDNVFIYLKEALELLERDNFKLSLEIITNLVLVFSYNDYNSTKLLSKKHLAVIVNAVAEVMKQWARRCCCSSSSANVSIINDYLNAAIKTISRFSLMLEIHGLGQAMKSCHSTLVAVAILSDASTNTVDVSSSGSLAASNSSNSIVQRIELATTAVRTVNVHLSNAMLLDAIGAVLSSYSACVALAALESQPIDDLFNDIHDDRTNSKPAIITTTTTITMALRSMSSTIVSHNNSSFNFDNSDKRTSNNKRLNSTQLTNVKQRRRTTTTTTTANEGDDDNSIHNYNNANDDNVLQNIAGERVNNDGNHDCNDDDNSCQHNFLFSATLDSMSSFVDDTLTFAPLNADDDAFSYFDESFSKK